MLSNLLRALSELPIGPQWAEKGPPPLCAVFNFKSQSTMVTIATPMDSLKPHFPPFIPIVTLASVVVFAL